MDNKKIGLFISSLRKEKKMTQEDLAKKLLVDRTLISKWERGLFIPTVEYLLELEKLFDVSINEILFGERKNLENNDKIKVIPINIIENEKRKLRRVLILFFGIIFLLLTLFFIYYFINNYNSIKVYKISGEDKNFHINDGIMITSTEKAYIKIGSVSKNPNIDIVKVRLYFKKNNIENDIFIGNQENPEILLINEFNYNELFEYHDIGYIVNGLYLEMFDNDNHKYTLKLDIQKDFANNNIINNKKIFPISDGTENIIDYSVPKYVKEKFSYNKKYEEYTKESKDGKYEIVEKFFPKLNIFIVIKGNKDTAQHFDYSIDDSIASFTLFQKDKLVNSFTYNFKDKKCIYGDCESSLVLSFKKNYLRHIRD